MNKFRIVRIITFAVLMLAIALPSALTLMSARIVSAATPVEVDNCRYPPCPLPTKPPVETTPPPIETTPPPVETTPPPVETTPPPVETTPPPVETTPPPVETTPPPVETTPPPVETTPPPVETTPPPVETTPPPVQTTEPPPPPTMPPATTEPPPAKTPVPTKGDNGHERKETPTPIPTYWPGHTPAFLVNPNSKMPKSGYGPTEQVRYLFGEPYRESGFKSAMFGFATALIVLAAGIVVDGAFENKRIERYFKRYFKR